ncbi:MAG: hypothetical protein HY748_13610 [Elusimicrobia bacterium]|nr:hypothetical protein [Elusimicrobiota bacterium]
MTKTLLALLAALSLCAPPGPEAQAAAKEDKAFARDDAIAAAERFISDQGYTAQPAAVSKDALAPDPLDASKDSDEILKARRGALEPKAFGARFDSDLWFVGFGARVGGRVRGVRMDAKGGGIKMVSQSLQADWLMGNDPKPQAISKDEAKGIAKRFVEAQGAGGLAKEPFKVENHQPDDKDGWDAWWLTFPKAALKKGAEPKPGEYAVVSVHKLNRDPKWVVELIGPPAPAPKAAVKPAAKPAPKAPAKPAPAPTKGGKKAPKK